MNSSLIAKQCIEV